MTPRQRFVISRSGVRVRLPATVQKRLVRLCFSSLNTYFQLYSSLLKHIDVIRSAMLFFPCRLVLLPWLYATFLRRSRIKLRERFFCRTISVVTHFDGICFSHHDILHPRTEKGAVLARKSQKKGCPQSGHFPSERSSTRSGCTEKSGF